MVSAGSDDPTVAQIQAFIELVSRLTLSNKVQQRFAGTTNVVGRSELAALRALGLSGRLSYRQLAGHLGLDPTTVSRLATRLVELDLVEREADETDKRRAWLALTPAGTQVLGTVEAVYLDYYDVAVGDWTDEQRATVREGLALLQDSLMRLRFDESGRATHLASSHESRTA